MARFSRVTPFLATRDLLGTVEFYTRVLGFRVHVLHPPDVPTLCILERDDCEIIFDSTLWPAAPSMTGQISFEVDDVRELRAAVDGRAEILWGPEVYSHGRREFSCRDPNGYALVFSEPTNDPPTCTG